MQGGYECLRSTAARASGSEGLLTSVQAPQYGEMMQTVWERSEPSCNVGAKGVGCKACGIPTPEEHKRR